METRSGSVPIELGSRRKPYPTPEEAKAKRAYVARGQNIRAGTIDGLFERDTKKIRPDFRALIVAALEKRDANNVAEYSTTHD